MKARISQEDLLKGIQTVYPVIPAKSTLPVLSYLLLDGRKDQLRLAGTDLEVGITTSVAVEIQEEGTVAVPAKRFHDLIKELPAGTLHLNARKNHHVSLESERAQFKISGIAGEEFPPPPGVNGSDSLRIGQDVLETMLSLTAFSAAKDESRPMLAGVLFVTEGSRLRLVSTDGRRMALVERETQSAPQKDHQVTVPGKTIAELRRLLGEGKSVEIHIKENQIAFDVGPTRLLSQLIAEPFPDYQRVIPKECPQKLSIHRERMLQAIRRVALWTTADSPSVRLDLKPDELILSKQTAEIGDAREQVEARYSGRELSVGFNPAYLIDVLKALPHSEVEFEMPGPDQPGVLRTQDHYLYIVLPMQLDP